MDRSTLKPIGMVHSPFNDPQDTPIQVTPSRDTVRRGVFATRPRAVPITSA